VGGVLDKVKAAGTLTCGVITEKAEYNKDDLHGGLDRLCAAAGGGERRDADQCRGDAGQRGSGGATAARYGFRRRAG
jgi:membrane protein involved in colicin uptake